MDRQFKCKKEMTKLIQSKVFVLGFFLEKKF
ncbi:Uncharacterised protein [Pseudomonas aeruginosa]|nr:Uncharacterised protein [Pseudomonas aeruginosa]